MSDDTFHPVRAWDPKAGKALLLPPAEFEQRFRAGEVHLVEGDTYDMAGPDGDVRSVGSRDVNEHFAHGYRMANKEQVVRSVEQNDPAAKWKAMADGAANAALMGAGDALRVKGGADPEVLRIRAEEHPTAHGIGTVLGAVGGTLALGEFGAGAMAERAAASVLGPEAGAGMLGHILVGAAGGAAEGTVRGVGDTFSEAALGRTDVTAGNLLAHAGLGAAFGAGVGGAFGALRGWAGRVKDANALQAGATGERAPETYGALANRVLKWAAERGGRADPEFAARAYHPDPAVRGAFWRDALEQPAAVKAATTDLKAAISEQEALAATDPALAKTLVKVHDDFGLPVDEGKLSEFIGSVDRPSGDGRLSNLRAHLANANARTKGDSLNLSGAFGEMEAAPTDVSAAEGFAGRAPGMSLGNSATRGMRINFTPGELTAEQRALYEHYQSFERGGGGNGQEFPLPASVVARLQRANGKLEGVLSNISENVSARNVLLKQLAAERSAPSSSEALLAGELMGVAAGHPALGLLGGGVAKLAGRAFTRPAETAKALLAMQRASDAVTSYIDHSLEAFVTSRPMLLAGRSLPRVVAPTTLEVLNAPTAAARRTAYEARIAEVSKLSDPQYVAERAGLAVQHLSEHAPAVAQQAAVHVTQAAGMLMQAVPRTLVAHNVLVPGKRAAQGNITDHDMRAFAEVDAAIQDPLRILDQLNAGRAPHPQAVAAVQAVHPTTWERMGQAFIAAATTSTKGLDPRRRTLASITFGIDATPAYGGVSLNARRRPAQPATGLGGGGGRRRGRTASGPEYTKLDRLMER
jgi:hypothetical protein